MIISIGEEKNILIDKKKRQMIKGRERGKKKNIS
jgi:hypothetical protein